MRYFKIGREWEPEIIGTTNGVYQAELIKDKFNRPQDYQDIMDFFESKTFWTKENKERIEGLNFEYIRLLKKSKLTDIVSFSPHLLGVDFLINSKTKRLLDGLSMANSHFLKAQVFTFDEKLIRDDFFVLYTQYCGFDAINFSKSVFYSGDEKMDDKTYHNFLDFRSWEDYWDRPNHEFVKAEKIIVRGNNYGDYIKTRLGGPFVSERLLDRWTSFGITGFIQLFDQTLEFE